MKTDLPAPVQEYLRATLIEEVQPLCLQLDANHKLIRHWGDLRTYALQRLQPGCDALQEVPLLVGTVETDTALELRFVELHHAIVAHVHIVPEAQTCYVVFLNVNEAHRYLQGVQQTFHEAKLRSLYDQRLVKRLRETQLELEQKKREAESASELKSRFIAAMSHEFRTPLTSVLGYADLCADANTLDREQLQHCNVAVRRNAQHLLNMVDNILDEARLEADLLEIHPTRVAVQQLVATLREMFAPLSAEKAIGFELRIAADVPANLLVDGMRLRQILINLIGNAVKFTDAGRVRTTLTWQDEQLVADVSDTGPGIPPEEQSAIFEAFRRSGDGSRPGAGLGLSIARQLLERMGGSLQLESSSGAGTRWRLCVPAQAAAMDRDAAVDLHERRGLRVRGRLFLLEDNPDITNLVRFYVQGSGVELVASADPVVALEALASTSVDLALIDLLLPGMNGFDFLQALRAAGNTTPAIAFTATSERALGQRLQQAGFAGHLAKPIDRGEFNAIVERYLQRRNEAPDGGPGLSPREAALLEQYRQSLPARRAHIVRLWEGRDTASNDGDTRELAHTLHQLVGSAGSYGYMEISNAAKAVLDLLRGANSPADKDDLRALMQKVFAAFDVAIGETEVAGIG